MTVDSDTIKEETSRATDPVSLSRLTEESGAPLWDVVKRRISKAILIGEWPPGTVLPSEVALAQQLGVAVGTVRRALTELTTEGLISRRRKTGTVVTGRSPHHSLRYFFQYFRLHKQDGALERSQARVIELNRSIADTEACEKLELPPGAEIVTLRRVRDVDGRPVMHEVYILPAARVPNFPMSPAEAPQLVYIYLLEQYGIRISAIREHLTATIATEQDCKLLQLSSPAAVLAIDEIAYDQANVPVLYGRSYASTANHVYINEVR
ncbi:GntR family transcriptional regulator [Burkholderia lata]|uniref:GntR family transcriptional regulator n=1 Tax=Burkholderia lata (strain ATCC 17760 / DSM 23089 / LMG 22485 / NCIMB 9086 / R18194 / 383) TaxID=482957 RepID=A0A6P2UR92_BURL3|nr:GntR family transcriptional regulator [Burkholderia lata]VWC76475.1 GntR family transcriptional regulator [Burkholderia lata]